MSTVQNHELLRQLAQVSLCQIADAGGASLPVDTEIRPLHPAFRICAPARTVLCPPDDNLTVHHALHVASPGEALVVSGSGGNTTALWGELMSISAQTRGLVGTIIDGPARDPVEIAELGYPVFARSIRPRRAAKDRYGSVGEPIRCGALAINNGDIVVADSNGMLVFPEHRLAEVVERALAVARREMELKQQFRAGRTYFELADLWSLVPTGKGRSTEV
jgi:4-hydroxy-4-methyl-2-oxoglutarate aldolase